MVQSSPSLLYTIDQTIEQTGVLPRGRGSRRSRAVTGNLQHMQRPTRFEHTRFLGDKRTQLVYDVDNWDDAAVINEIVAAGIGLCFGPDTEVEARNRGYTLATADSHRIHRKPRA